MELLKKNLSRYEPSFDKALLERAEQELGETPEKREEACVSLYVQYVAQEGAELGQKYKDKLTDPVYLLRFLRVSKFNIEKALGKLREGLKKIVFIVKKLNLTHFVRTIHDCFA